MTLVTACSFPIRVTDGRYTANGKRFMEMFCLDLREPLKVTANCTEGEFWQLQVEADCFLV